MIFTYSRDTAYNQHYKAPQRQDSLVLCLPIMVILNIYTTLPVPWSQPHCHSLHILLPEKNPFVLAAQLHFIYS
jgi:hypothetical protein